MDDTRTMERCLATVKFLEHLEGYQEILDNRKTHTTLNNKNM
jgi:hypothetical protein